MGGLEIKPTKSQLNDLIQTESPLQFSLLNCKLGIMIPYYNKVVVIIKDVYENAM